MSAVDDSVEDLVLEHSLQTVYDPKPIPVRGYDWSCVSTNYEPGDPIGYGRTEAEAVSEYLELAEAVRTSPIAGLCGAVMSAGAL